jgi:hypothetical protein
VTVPKAPPLRVSFPGSRPERRKEGHLRAARSVGRDGSQPVTGGARGNARVAARRAPQVQRRSCQPSAATIPGRRIVPAPPSAPNSHLARQGAHLPRDHAPDGARRAPRAFKDVKKIVTALGQRPLSAIPIFEDLRWSERFPMTLLIISGMDNTRLQFRLTLYTSSA